MKLIAQDLLWMTPASLALGATLASLQPGAWLTAFAATAFLLLLAFSLFTLSLRAADGGKHLVRLLAVAFALRLLAGVAIHVLLPIYGHTDADDKAGFVFTDAHRRDDEAWDLAASDAPILNAFSQKFAYDQYGGLLAFSALVYRYLSPDAHRPLLLILLSAIVAALGVPFLWRAARQAFGESVAWVAAWVFALYPESILLGASIMREPYLLTFSALTLYGFVVWLSRAERSETTVERSRSVAWIWLALGLLGMLLVSPAVAIAHLILFAGWLFFANEQRSISWKTMLAFAAVFFAGLFFLSASLNRSGEFNTSSPLSVVNDWLRLAVQWNAYGIERDSGWVQKLFDEMPQWLRLPFVAVYGILQPVLPAALVAPTVPMWKVIYIARAIGWYALLPAMILSFGAGAGSGLGRKRAERSRSIILWLTLFTWTWILLAALRAGGDMWDNPRYRTILFVWQAILAGVVWVWRREARSHWAWRVIACEVVFVLVFTQWYLSRYLHWGGQLPFAAMVALIGGAWLLIVGAGWWRDRKSG